MFDLMTFDNSHKFINLPLSNRYCTFITGNVSCTSSHTLNPTGNHVVGMG